MGSPLSQEQKDLIYTLLEEKQLSTAEVSRRTSLCRETIRRHARKFGIKPFNGKTAPLTFDTISNNLKQLIIGSLLGDGSFVRSSNSTSSCSLSIGHCEAQYDYIKYKYDLCTSYDLVTKISTIHTKDTRFKCQEYTWYRFKTRSNPLFTEVRTKCYDIQGKKHINFDVIQDIDALGLAIWYMDDGSVTKNSCIFSTCSFSIEEQEKLAYFLLGRFKLHFTVGKNDNSLYLKSKDWELFKSIVSPYIIDSLKYKLVPYRERVLDKSDELLESCDANQQPSQPLTKLEGSETNS